MNSYDEMVQFTVVEEDKNTKTIEFLNTKVYNCGNKVKTNWYHKPIASNRLLNFYSTQPKNMIVKLIVESFIVP